MILRVLKSSALPISLIIVLVFFIGMILGAGIYKLGYFDGLEAHRAYSEWQFYDDYRAPVIDDSAERLVTWRKGGD